MNFASYSIKKGTVTWFLTAVVAIYGMVSFFELGKLEDPAYTIKTAVVTTVYPGASPEEVENEVTSVIESAAQQLAQTDKVRSLSRAGVSTVYVDIKDTFVAADLPQIWDELRRKVNDAQRQLPPGVQASMVNDDYGDVYGIYFALTGDGYSWRELEKYADDLRKELLLVKGVAKVAIGATQQQTVYVNINRSQLAQYGITRSQISSLLTSQNLVTGAGDVQVFDEYIRISPTGYFTSVEDIGNLLISSSTGSSLRLRDLAEIKRGYTDPPTQHMKFNGQNAIGIGISGVAGGNVIDLGEAVRQRMNELETFRPVGMELGLIYYQSDSVSASINNFMTNLIEAIAIVIGILLIFMGVRSGVLIGAVLLLTILATFIAMKLVGIDLQSISLGALIIALGMLVDNAIVVADGILVRTQQGINGIEAASEVVQQTQMPLLGATIIASIAFAPVGMSPDSTGEFCRSLFQVVGISLMLSWVLAVTVTPLAGVTFLKTSSADEIKDPYDTKMYKMYKGILEFCLHKRKLVIVAIAGVLFAGIWGFSFVDQSFFPNDKGTLFTVNFYRLYGSYIEDTWEDAKTMEKFLLEQPETDSVTVFAGSGGLRFMLSYSPEDPASNFGHLIVRAKDSSLVEPLMKKLEDFSKEKFPWIEPRVRTFSKGSGGGAKIQIRFQGQDANVLREIQDEALRIMQADENTINVRSDWQNRVKVIRPILSDSARAIGITRNDIANALEIAYKGAQSGLYREEDKLLPIVVRLSEAERGSPEGINETQVWSLAAGKYQPLSTMISGISTVAEDPIIQRRNRLRQITVECDPKVGNANLLFERLRPQLESIKLPSGYFYEWGGEYENSQKAQEGLKGMLPVALVVIVSILVMLFNGFRQPIIIILCLPLSIVGVTIGLLLMNRAFDFLALLGFLSLAGMLIKNAIVLIDQIDLEMREGKEPYHAIIDSAISRVRPVMMAALTTVLGMIPLYFDVLFSALAVTIMFGLTFATVLTLVVVPVFYAAWLRA